MEKKLFGILLTFVVFVSGLRITHASYIGFYDEDGGNKIGYMEHVHNTVDITVDKPKKEGFAFTGWASNNNNVTFDGDTLTLPWGSGDYRNNFPIEVFATWTEAYTITYELDGGSANNPESYTANDEIEIENPTKDGYEFLGWLDETGDELGKDLKISAGNIGNKTFIAAWKKNAAVVNNNPKTGDNLLFNISLVFGGLISLIILSITGRKTTNN